MDYYLFNNRKYYISIKTTLNAYWYVSLFDDNGKEILNDIKSSLQL